MSRGVPSGAPSHTTSSALWPPKLSRICLTVSSLVMSPWMVTTPSIGAIFCRSTETTRVSCLRLVTAAYSKPLAASRFAMSCDQLPGAAQMSMTLWTPSKMLYISSTCISL